MRDKLQKFSIGCLLDMNFGPLYQPAPSRDFVKCASDQLVNEGVLAEQAGFEGVFVPESHMRTETIFSDPLPMLAALAGRTERVRLGTYCLIPAYGWNPMHLAEATALIDHLSNGRLTLALALGLVPESFRMFGVDPKNKVALFKESVAIIKKAWTSHERFDFSGQHFQLENVWLTPKPLQQDPHPTIWSGGLSDKAIQRAGTFATGWCSTPFPIRKDIWDRQVELFVTEAKAHGVENPKIILMRDGFVASNKAEAERICSETFLPEWLYYFDAGVLSQQDPALTSRSDVSIENMRRHLVVGSPDDCIASLQQYRDLYHADYVLIRFRSAYGPGADATRRCMELFGERVLPHFH
jgi:alkanesulfonate monooxygenase SsuD/methylene tetrahydromethanopterin reductase-like flavin-dependent oxidoreductase (luciferase family)